MTKERLRIAIQKSGRLSDESLQLLKQLGFQLRHRRDQLFCHCENFPLDVLLVRDDDIPLLVMDGVCDFGIVGTNVLQEASLERENFSLEIAESLTFGYCRLALAVSENFLFHELSDLKNKRIATTYPHLLQAFLAEHYLNAEIVTLSGAVEIAPRLGIADAICDLVSTGSTLEANHLKEVATVFKSQAVLVRSPKIFPESKRSIATLLQNRLQGVLQAYDSKYIMLHAPKSALADIVKLIPGAEHPTLMTLEGDPEKVVMHALCRESVFWETLEQLKAAGASSILVLPVEKMML